VLVMREEDIMGIVEDQSAGLRKVA
jgi:hypothetical protein